MRRDFFIKPGILSGISGLLLWVMVATPVFAQQINTVVGDGTFGFGGDGGAATSANIADPVGVFVDSLGNVYVADTNNRRIRKVDTSGVITSIAGNGNFGFSGDGGLATDASLADPTGVFVDGAGVVYVADTNNQRIRKIDTDGVIITIAGDGNAGFAGDGGPATSARLNFPTGIFVDAVGNVFFADRENHRIRKIDTLGVITTIAGNGSFGSAGDGGQATSASLAFPSGVYVDGTGQVFVADRFNYKVRKIDASGVITTFAGTGVFGFSGDGGQATSANLAFPSGVYADDSGNVLIADRDNHRIRKVDPSGVIATIVGNGTPTFAGDGGGATDASLNRPSAIWGDALGAVWVADTNNRRIRKISAPLHISTQVQALQGETSVQPGQESVIWTVGMTGDGSTELTQIQVTLSDLSSPTGLDSNDLTALRLYESTDAVLDGGDTQIASLGGVPIGTAAALVPSATLIPPAESERFYLITAVMSASAVDGHALRVGFASGGISTSVGTLGQAVLANDVNRNLVDIVATQLVFSIAPLGSVSGQSLTTQPIVVAQNASGNIDRDFSDVVTLFLSQGSGQLLNGSVTAVNGVATFANVTYSAVSDNESVVIGANDEDGVGTDLPTVLTGAFTSNVVATQLVFATQPAGVVSGLPFSTQPVLVARDAQGITDTDFSDVVTLTESSAGTLSQAAIQAVNGVATFSNVVYHALLDGESFTLAADDEVGGSEGDLGSVQAQVLTSDVVATRMVFSTQPAGSVSGHPLVTQPIVVAQDDSGGVDVDFSETVSLTLFQGAGAIANGAVQAQNGVSTFTALTYVASADGESFRLSANDEDGVGSNLPIIQSNGLASDVVATQLTFLIQPADVSSGHPFGTQPIIVAQDSLGALDTDFSDVVTLSEDGAGTLSNASMMAVNGVATFANVIYTATADGESFTISANDEVGGAEGDLDLAQGPLLTSNIQATKLVYSTLPAGVLSGAPLITQPILMAVDDSGRVDTQFSEVVTVSLGQGQGRLYNNAVQAVNGVVTFSNLIYVAHSDGESVDFVADDQGEVDTDLPTVTSGAILSDVLATHLLFSTQPMGSVSGQLLGTQPVVVALNDSGQVDVDFGDVVTLTHNGEGSLVGGSVQAVSGVATFGAVAYTASADGESVGVVADDAVGGTEGNLASVQAVAFESDVLAKRMVFDVQPMGAVSGQSLTTQPIVKAIDDSGRVDTDFADLVTLSSSVGTLANHAVQAVNGVVTFTDVVFTATLDKQNFTLLANDESGGAEGDLPSVSANTLSAEVTAVKLAYLVQPSGSVSGQALTIQPLVVAVDANDMIDVDFTSLVTLSVDGVGSLHNALQPAVSGIATFTQVIYETDGGEQTFGIIASAPGVASVTSLPLSTDVIATRLVFSVQPAGSVSGRPLLVVPVVEARDSLGQIDKSFAETLTLTVQGSGHISGATAVADSGRAIFSDLTYFAAADQESFAVFVDDESGGQEGDLPAVLSQSLMSDVIATRLNFVVQPTGSVNGRALQVQPQVAAVDSSGIVDTGFTEVITMEVVVGGGTLVNQTATMQNGVAGFVGLGYLSVADGEAFVLRADDLVGGLDLSAADGDTVVCDVVASHLTFTTQPAGSVSGKPLSTQPVLAAVDSLGLVDVDFSELVNLTTQTAGALTNIVVPMANGVGEANALTFTAVQDRQGVVLVANDAVGGLDLALVSSDSFVCDVVASSLHFDVQPQGTSNGHLLNTQPVVVAHDDGVVDLDFNDVVSLATNGLGQLYGQPVAAVEGVAVFSDVRYEAAFDQEGSRLIAKDTVLGTEGQLAPVESSLFVTEVTATHLHFRVTPSGIISGRPFLTQPVVAAIDSLGVIDADFNGSVQLTTQANGQLSDASILAVNGVAEFVEVSYTATSGLETFKIQAEAVDSGVLPVLSETLTAGAGAAHHLGFFYNAKNWFADGVSARTIVVRVLDENNNPSLNDGTTRISFLVQGAAVGGGSRIVDSGEAGFEVVSLLQTGTVYLQASAEGLLGAVDSFQTVAGEAQSLSIVFDTEPLLANGASSREVRLQLLDAQGNLRTQDNTTLVALGVSGAASEGGGAKVVTGGEATFVVKAGHEPGLIHLRGNSGGVPEVVAGLIVGEIRPNLTFTHAPVGPEVISKNESHSIRLQIKNAGLDTVRNAFDVVAMLVGGADSIFVGQSIVSASIAPDSTLNVVVPFSVPSFSFSALASDYHWVVVVDHGQFVLEQDERDNMVRGNAVAFPELAISHSEFNFETVVPDTSYEKIFLVENRGRAPLRVMIAAQDSQLMLTPMSGQELVLEPGRNRLVKVVFYPQQFGPFVSQLVFNSNDPKGDVIIDVRAQVAAADRVLLDLDDAIGNQNLTLLESKRNESVIVELFLNNLPPLQAVSIDLQYDAQLLDVDIDSWVLGGYFVGGAAVSEAEVVNPGIIRLSGGSVGNQGVNANLPFGKVRFQTPLTLPTTDTHLETPVEAIQMRFLQEDGVRDSLQIQAVSHVVFKTQAVWPDLDGDDMVGFGDFLIFISAFRQTETSPGWSVELPNKPFPYTPYKRFDIDQDGQIGFFDFVTYAQDFKSAQNQP